MTSTAKITVINDNAVRHCHLCLQEFHNLSDLHRHIDHDHSLKHPFITTYESMMAQNNNFKPKNGIRMNH